MHLQCIFCTDDQMTKTSIEPQKNTVRRLKCNMTRLRYDIAPARACHVGGML